MAENNTQKAITLGNLAALRSILPTKTEVVQQIEQAALGEGNGFATDDEVLALFAETSPEQGT